MHGAPEMKGFSRLIDNPRGKVMLDAGMGYGYEANLLARRGARVYDIDASPTMVALAKRSYPALAERFSTASLEKLPFPARHFDLIFCKYAPIISHRSTPHSKNSSPASSQKGYYFSGCTTL
ncbi:class I SAM-dependent methyltransferase [Candidatus Parcubacteria bacterium]|nr:class I SAM-dependent methyltransferase [Candidatus Parcubacteria bacterium]